LVAFYLAAEVVRETEMIIGAEELITNILEDLKPHIDEEYRIQWTDPIYFQSNACVIRLNI
jgi:hypothetical protein